MSLDNNLILSIPMFIVEPEYYCPLFWTFGRPSQLRATARSQQLLCVPTFPDAYHIGHYMLLSSFLVPNYRVIELSCHFLTTLSLGRRVSANWQRTLKSWSCFCQQLYNYNSFICLYYSSVQNSVPSSFLNSNSLLPKWIAVRKSMEDASLEIWRSLPSASKPSPDSHCMDRTPTVLFPLGIELLLLQADSSFLWNKMQCLEIVTSYASPSASDNSFIIT